MRKWKCPHNVKVEGYTTIMGVSGYGGFYTMCSHLKNLFLKLV